MMTCICYLENIRYLENLCIFCYATPATVTLIQQQQGSVGVGQEQGGKDIQMSVVLILMTYVCLLFFSSFVSLTLLVLGREGGLGSEYGWESFFKQLHHTFTEMLISK